MAPGPAVLTHSILTVRWPPLPVTGEGKWVTCEQYWVRAVGCLPSLSLGGTDSLPRRQSKENPWVNLSPGGRGARGSGGEVGTLHPTLGMHPSLCGSPPLDPLHAPSRSLHAPLHVRQPSSRLSARDPGPSARPPLHAPQPLCMPTPPLCTPPLPPPLSRNSFPLDPRAPAGSPLP